MDLTGALLGAPHPAVAIRACDKGQDVRGAQVSEGFHGTVFVKGLQCAALLDEDPVASGREDGGALLDR